MLNEEQVTNLSYDSSTNNERDSRPRLPERSTEEEPSYYNAKEGRRPLFLPLLGKSDEQEDEEGSVCTRNSAAAMAA